ncbi:MAG: transketolase [Candidatus Margulisbacteria bacterium]|nr:transketolase [Candidatus Margulisiibacteriota bacterium]
MSELVIKVEEKAKNIRKNIIKMLAEAGSGHPGGSLSATDILAALFFGGVFKYDPKNIHWEDRDYFILCKGHGAPALYATMAEAGFFPEKELMTLRKLGSKFQGHPDRNHLPGIEVSTGSLGQGLSVAVGMALGLRLDGKGNRVFAVLGDGEIQEGQVWEAAMNAAHKKVDNLIAFLDRNELQIDGRTEQIKAIEPVRQKWEAFGWKTFEIDGHNIQQILDVIEQAKKVKNMPVMVIAHTVKGKGVSFMEGKVNYHGVAPSREEEEKAMKELGHA